MMTLIGWLMCQRRSGCTPVGRKGARLARRGAMVFASAALLMAGVTATVAAAADQEAEPMIRIAIIGDSTVADFGPERHGLHGWGQSLRGFVQPGRAEVINLAQSGRSSKSFLRSGQWDKVLGLQPRPDYLLIQFGHNDLRGKGPDRETLPDPIPVDRPAEGLGSQDDDWYRQNLARYVAEARSAGMVPVVVTPPERRQFTAKGTIRPMNQPWAQAAAAVAEELDVLAVDLNAFSVQLLEQAGPQASGAMHRMADGRLDRTHYNQAGARILAEYVAGVLYESVPALQAVLTPPSSAARDALLVDAESQQDVTARP